MSTTTHIELTNPAGRAPLLVGTQALQTQQRLEPPKTTDTWVDDRPVGVCGPKQRETVQPRPGRRVVLTATEDVTGSIQTGTHRKVYVTPIDLVDDVWTEGAEEVLGVNGVVPFQVSAKRRVAVECDGDVGIAAYVRNDSDRHAVKIVDQRIARIGEPVPPPTWSKPVPVATIPAGLSRVITVNDNTRVVVESTEEVNLDIYNSNPVHTLRLRTSTAKGETQIAFIPPLGSAQVGANAKTSAIIEQMAL